MTTSVCTACARGEGARVEAQGGRARMISRSGRCGILRIVFSAVACAPEAKVKASPGSRGAARDAAPREPARATGEERGRELLDVCREAGVVARFVHQNELFARVLGRVVARHAQTELFRR